MIIRQETKEEYPAIYRFVKTAFQTARVSDGHEQDFVDKLRNSGNYIPELALVAEENGNLIGHIMLTELELVDQEKTHRVLLLAPLSVALEHRNRGVGSALVEESFRLAREMGHQAVVLVGDPNYYQRFGFCSADRFHIQPKQEIPSQYVLACELVPGSLKEVHGVFDAE